jgi:catechol 2,3-dioxygenase-like lactoylglutathione lyase family enzyme
MKLLGIDNIFFEVSDLEKAVDFYSQLGLQLKFKKENQLALFKIGNEESGLVILQSNNKRPGKFWIEVKDALKVKDECESKNIQGVIIETQTGFTFEVTDPFGNSIGFADYSKRPELARKSI